MKLTDFIEKYYGGNKSAFARANNTTPQHVNDWVKGNYIVIDGVLYSPRREVITNELKK